MNTLEESGMWAFVFLIIFVQDARNWRRHVQPWEDTVLAWGWALTHGLLLSICTVALLYLLMHPAEIQPAPAWSSWVAGFCVAFILLSFLVRVAVYMVRRIRQPRRSS